MAKSKEQHVHEVFESISESYDKMNSVISFQMHKLWRDDIDEKNECQKRLYMLGCLLWYG